MYQWLQYTAWPDGDNHLSGAIGTRMLSKFGVAYNTTVGGNSVDLTCATEVLPTVTWNDWLAQSMVTHLLIFHLLIHPDGNIWMVDVVESSGSHSLGMPASRSRSPMRRPRRSRPTPRAAESAGSASPRQPDRVRRNQLLSPGDPQHCASQGVQLPVGPLTLHYRPAAAAGDPMQSQGLVKTTLLPTRNTNIHTRYFAQATMSVVQNTGHASGTGQCSAGRLASAEGWC